MIVPVDNDDNRSFDCIPFKGPFKGKGENRRAARILGDQYDEVIKDMERVVVKFHEIFPQPRPVNLSIQRRPGRIHVLLSWRQAIRSGSFLHLFGSEDGEALLVDLGPHTVRRLAEFDRLRQILNFRSKLLFAGVDGYRLYRMGQEAEAAWFDGHSRDPLQRTG
jgi:hypothetical protein